MMKSEFKYSIIVACLVIGACGQKPAQREAKFIPEPKLIKPGDLYEMGDKEVPKNGKLDSTITMVITNPYPFSATAKITSSDGSYVESGNLQGPISSIDMDLADVAKNNKDYVIVNIELVTDINTKFHPDWPLTTSKIGRGQFNIISDKKQPTRLSFWIDRKNWPEMKKELYFNIHYRTTYTKNGKPYVNDWAFDPKVRNEG